MTKPNGLTLVPDKKKHQTDTSKFREIRRQLTVAGHRILEDAPDSLNEKLTESFASLRLLCKEFVDRYDDEILLKFEKVFPDPFFSKESIEDLATGGVGIFRTKGSEHISINAANRKMTYLGGIIEYFLNLETKSVSKFLDRLDVPRWPLSLGPSRTAVFYAAVSRGNVGHLLVEIQSSRPGQMKKIAERENRKAKKQTVAELKIELVETVRNNELLLRLFELMGAKEARNLMKDPCDELKSTLSNPLLYPDIIHLGSIVSRAYGRKDHFLKKAEMFSKKYRFDSRSFMAAVNARDFWAGRITQEELESSLSDYGMALVSIANDQIKVESTTLSLSQTFFQSRIDEAIGTYVLAMRRDILEVAFAVKRKYETELLKQTNS